MDSPSALRHYLLGMDAAMTERNFKLRGSSYVSSKSSFNSKNSGMEEQSSRQKRRRERRIIREVKTNMDNSRSLADKSISKRMDIVH